jgi:hypothetical protein
MVINDGDPDIALRNSVCGFLGSFESEQNTIFDGEYGIGTEVTEVQSHQDLWFNLMN